jgi:hypothetical protein
MGTCSPGDKALAHIYLSVAQDPRKHSIFICLALKAILKVIVYLTCCISWLSEFQNYLTCLRRYLMAKMSKWELQKATS